MSSPTDTLAPLATFLTSVSQTLTRSVWLRVFDNPVSDNPDCVVVPDVKKASNDAELYKLQQRATAMQAKKKRLEELGRSSLQKLTSLSPEKYTNILMGAGMLRLRAGKYNVQSGPFEKWVRGLEIGAEFIAANPSSRIVQGGNRYYICLGPQQRGVTDSPVAQFSAAAKDPSLYSPPELPFLSVYQRKLRMGLRVETSTQEDKESDSSWVQSDSEEDNNELSEEDFEQELVMKTKTSYPTISSLGICLSMLSDSALELLIGELVHLQRERQTIAPANVTPSPVPPVARPTPVSATGNPRVEAPIKAKQRVSFRYRKGETEYRAFPIPLHKSKKAFTRYHKTKPYVHELVHWMGTSKSRSGGSYERGARRLLRLLAKASPAAYRRVAKEAGLNLGVHLDAVGLGALKMDCRFKDWQVKQLLRHLRFANGGASVSVPFREIKQFGRGFVEPKTKNFKHQYPPGKFEWVECEYQPVDECFVNVLGDLLTTHRVQPDDVQDVYFVLGGDHGQEAFRLCFRAIVLLKTGKLLYEDYGGAGLVPGKDDRDVLDASLMPWLTEDLKTLSQAKVHIATLADGAIGVTLASAGETPAEGTAEGAGVQIWNTGDLKWMAMLLGMDDMSGEWCIFCLLRQKEWLEGKTGEKRTIEKICELAKQNLSGAKRRGVKFSPYWDFIPIDNYAVPLLHLMIGVFNDAIDYFTASIEKVIVGRPSCELKLIEELAATKRQLDLLRPQVAEWHRSREGNRRSTLLTKFNKVKAQVERGEEVVAPMSEEELQEFRNLQLIFQQKKKERDQLASKQVALNAKLDTYHQGRKLDPSSLHNRVEDLWKSQGLNRGKAFGGKFQGIDARPVMEKPSRYFGEGMKAILRAGKGPGVEDSYICQLCDGVAEVMGSWNDFFLCCKKKNQQRMKELEQQGWQKKLWTLTLVWWETKRQRCMSLRHMLCLSICASPRV